MNMRGILASFDEGTGDKGRGTRDEGRHPKLKMMVSILSWGFRPPSPVPRPSSLFIYYKRK